ncbi:hypothetical protein EAF04_003375 [Stromatinia cepivora]|nr:hypothetical protein EAF04_003375 [Stromatinia cepivora]
MLFFNPNNIMRTMIALLSVPFLTISIANATPITANEVSIEACDQYFAAPLPKVTAPWLSTSHPRESEMD